MGGGIGQFALSQLDPTQQAALIQQTAPDPTQTQVLPGTASIAGSTADLESQATAGRQQLTQSLQQQGQQPGQQWSPNNPFAQIVSDYQARVKASQPNPNPPGGPVKRILSSFFSGMGDSMMHEAGLPTQYQQRQTDIQNLDRASQMATQWENNNSEIQYRAALLNQLQQEQSFRAQMQPGAVQHQQLENQLTQQQVTAGQQTVHPAMTTDDLQSMGLSPALSQQFAGKPLSSADMAALRQISVGAQRHPYDYGTDGTGPGKGIWLVDAQYNPIKQLSPTSETARSTSLAKMQQQLQLQMGTAGQQGIDIVEGRLDPSQVSSRAQNYGMILNAANAYSQQKYGQPFDFSKATADYKYAQNPATKNTLNYLNSLVGPDGKSGNLREVIRQSNDIGRTPFPALNDAAAWGRLQAGSPKMAAYHAAVTEVADQVAKIMQGGGSGNGTSDAKMRQAMDLFNTGFNRDQIKSVASTLQTLLANRKQGLIGNNSYLQRRYGPQANPSPTPVNPSLAPTASAGFDWNSAPVVQP
jgi:hypothetical protein